MGLFRRLGPRLRLALQRGRRRAVDSRRLLLADQAAVGREHWVEIQRAEESVIAQIVEQKITQLGDFVVAQVFA